MEELVIEESASVVRARYAPHYFRVLQDLRTAIEDTNGTLKIKRFCEENGIFYIATTLIKAGILENTGPRNFNRWEWRGPIPTLQQAEALLRTCHLSSLLKYSDTGEVAKSPPKPKSSKRKPTIVPVNSDDNLARFLKNEAPKVKSKRKILLGMLYSKVEYFEQ